MLYERKDFFYEEGFSFKEGVRGFLGGVLKLKFVFVFFCLNSFAGEQSLKLREHRGDLELESEKEDGALLGRIEGIGNKKVGAEFFEKGLNFEEKGDFKQAFLNYERARDAGDIRGEEAISRLKKQAENAFFTGQFRELGGRPLGALYQFTKSEALRYPRALREKERVLSLVEGSSKSLLKKAIDRKDFRQALSLEDSGLKGRGLSAEERDCRSEFLDGGLNGR